MKRRIDKSESKAAAAGKSQRTGRHKSKDLNVQSRSQWWAWTKMGFLTFCCLFVTIPFLLEHLSDSVDLTRPSDVGLNYTINIYLKPEEGVRLGVWLVLRQTHTQNKINMKVIAENIPFVQILSLFFFLFALQMCPCSRYTVPKHKWEESKGQDLEWFEKALGDGSPIFIYLHGNTGNRASYPHRIGIANVLSAAGYHVLAMDYRGFGDSTSEPTERGLTTDTLYLYNWVKARSGNSLVCVWGHSLGSGVATNTAVKLQEKGKHFDGIILEGAFTTGKGVHQHPFTWFYWKFPYIQYFLFNPLKDNILELPSNENLKQIRTPLLILHAEDDPIVPFVMAKELYNTAKNAQKSDKRVKLILFESSLGYLHNGLYKDPRLQDFIREFLQSLMA